MTADTFLFFLMQTSHGVFELLFPFAPGTLSGTVANTWLKHIHIETMFKWSWKYLADPSFRAV